MQLRKGTRLAALAQEPSYAPDTPVLSAVLQGDAPVLALLARYRAALARAEGGDAAAAAAVAALTPEMDAANAWGIEAEVRIILSQLGCEALLERTMGELTLPVSAVNKLLCVHWLLMACAHLAKAVAQPAQFARDIALLTLVHVIMVRAARMKDARALAAWRAVRRARLAKRKLS